MNELTKVQIRILHNIGKDGNIVWNLCQCTYYVAQEKWGVTEKNFRALAPYLRRVSLQPGEMCVQTGRTNLLYTTTTHHVLNAEGLALIGASYGWNSGED